jgi:hypothetical protein
LKNVNRTEGADQHFIDHHELFEAVSDMDLLSMEYLESITLLIKEYFVNEDDRDLEWKARI